MKKEIITTTSFSKSGAINMAKLLKSKYDCTIIGDPKFDDKRGMWVVKYTEPKDVSKAKRSIQV